jgi:glycosyltransferase involved in cell wall biosynthesis
MWKGKSVSIIFPTYNEKDSIKAAIEDFFASGYVDEIIVVNNNAAEGTHYEVAKTKAKEVFEKKQGYPGRPSPPIVRSDSHPGP